MVIRMRCTRCTIAFFRTSTTVFSVHRILHLYLVLLFSSIDASDTRALAWTLLLFSSGKENRCQAFCDTGVTSLYWWMDLDEERPPHRKLMVAGTKNGGIFCRQHPQLATTDTSPSADEWQRLQPPNVHETSRYPIYSLTSSSTHLFCGGGNRYIAVWSKKLARNIPKNTVNDDASTPFQYNQDLGPHTGWVKDLVYDDQHALLHSIGCNCIETWDALSMQHQAKRSIENSPAMGTTLSSDLLCLCLVSKNGAVACDDATTFLVSGGVDGRIHLWTSDPYAKLSQKRGKPLCALTAHDGRVNKMVHSKALDALLSVGNDGKVSVCRLLSDSNTIYLKQVASFPIAGHQTSDFRLTAITLLEDNADSRQCHIAIGSSNGQVVIATIKETDDGMLEHAVEATIVELTDQPLVYALAWEATTTTKVDSLLWVGHANGLESLRIRES